MRALAVLALAASLSALAAPAVAQPAAATARLVAVQGGVEVAAAEAQGGARPGSAGDVLARGARVQTGDDAAAELALADGTRLLVGPRTALVMFTSPYPPAAGQPPSTTTTLTRGSVRIEPGDGAAAQTFPLATTPAWVFARRATAAVHVEPGARVTRVAVYRGRVRVRAAQREFLLGAGFGFRAEVGTPPAPPRPLPRPPAWTAPPPAMVVSYGEDVDVQGRYGPAAGQPPPAHWRVVVARDERFADVVSDARVAGAVTRWEGHGLTPGAYFVRVSALDADRFEGAPGPAARVVVAAPRVVPGGDGRRAQVEVPEGFACGLDGAPLAPTTVPLQLSPGRDHRLRCASRADGSDARDMVIPAAQAGPLVRAVRVEPARLVGAGGVGVLVVRLADARGVPVSWATFAVAASDGVQVGDLREGETRGTYTGMIRWPAGVRAARLRVVVNGADVFEETLR